MGIRSKGDGIRKWTFKMLEDKIDKVFMTKPFGQAPLDRKLMSQPVKHGGLGIFNPNKTMRRYHKASKIGTSLLIETLTKGKEFSLEEHLAEIKQLIGWSRIEKERDINKIMTPFIISTTPELKRALARVETSGDWLTTIPLVINGTILGKNEFKDNLCIRYNMEPVGLPKFCDGCGKEQCLSHILEFKKGGLMLGRHDEVAEELSFIETTSKNHTEVRDDPEIHVGKSNEGTNDERLGNGERGDLLIRGLFSKQLDCIIDVRITNLEAKSHRGKKPQNVLENKEREKKQKYSESCKNQNRDFSPFLVSDNVMLVKEAREILRRLAESIENKWDSPFSHVLGFVKERMSMAITRASNRCVRGSRVPTSQMSVVRPHWDDGAGLK